MRAGRGKGLGGSTCINFLYWTRPQREEIDGEHPSGLSRARSPSHHITRILAIEKLGNKGWNWERFFEASKRAESSVSFHCLFRTTLSKIAFLSGFSRRFRASAVVNNDPDYHNLYVSESVGHNGTSTFEACLPYAY